MKYDSEIMGLNMKRAVGYVRVSTEDQAREGISLDNQRDKIKAYAILKEFELVNIIEDKGISAKNLSRPGIKEILDIVRKKDVEAIITYKLDRMFRSTVDALETTKQFNKMGIAFHSIQETIDTQSAMGKFFFTLTAAIAEMERGIVSERTRSALKYKKSRNEKTGGITPFGYCVNKNGQLFADKNEQKIIKKILRLHNKGWNYSMIARKLNSLGHKTKQNKSWYPQSIKNVVLYE